MTDADPCFPSTGAAMGFHEALERLLQQARPVSERESVHLVAAPGRVLAEPVISAVDVPPWDNAAMDGYALAHTDLQAGKPVTLPVSQRITAGSVGLALLPGTAARIFTGAPLPLGADTVVMQETCEVSAEGVRIRGPAEAGQHVRPRANDIRAGATALAAGVRMGPQHVGLAAAVGVAGLSVWRRLRVALFSTGDELVTPGLPLGQGQIYNSNRYLLHALLSGLGCRVLDLGIVPDRLESTREALVKGAEMADVILTSGGVSVGEEDHIKRAVEAEGNLELWKVRVKPGKPMAYGRIRNADFIGVPGNPVSAFVVFSLFVRPFLLRRMGAADVAPQRLTVTAAFDWPKPGERREFLRGRLRNKAHGGPGVELFPRQGSDVLSAVAWGNGLVEVPEEAVIRAGDSVCFLPFTELLG